MRTHQRSGAMLLSIIMCLLALSVQAGIFRPSQAVTAYQCPPRLPVSRRASSPVSPRSRAIVRPAVTDDFVSATLTDPEIVGAVTQEQLVVSG